MERYIGSKMYRFLDLQGMLGPARNGKLTPLLTTLDRSSRSLFLPDCPATTRRLLENRRLDSAPTLQSNAVSDVILDNNPDNFDKSTHFADGGCRMFDA